MRLDPIAIIPLILAFAALIMAGGATGLLLPLTIGMAAATVLVALAVIYHYVTPPPVPVENFSVWADVGKPAAELRRTSPDDIEAAVRIADTDIGYLSSNAGLLSARLSLLFGMHGFEELKQKKMDKLSEKLLQDIRAVVKRLDSEKKFSRRALSLIERCASRADRMADKLHDFQREKPEIIRKHVEPLSRAAKKLSLDLKFASWNISKFVKRAHKKA